MGFAWVLLPHTQWWLPHPMKKSAATTQVPQSTPAETPPPSPSPELGPRHQLNYQQWVLLLKKEADVIASRQPQNLAILLGDSLSLWFPNELLPTEVTWLNQGISGETSAGLLKRLSLFDKTQPDVIFLMIGINDLIRGVEDQTILTNQELIIRNLRQVHPQATIILQSILPHGAEKATWQRRDRLLEIPNSRIQQLNQRLKVIAQAQGAIYLDLYPLFAEESGNMNMDLSTDGLHLSPKGYLVWHYALQIVNQMVMDGGLRSVGGGETGKMPVLR